MVIDAAGIVDVNPDQHRCVGTKECPRLEESEFFLNMSVAYVVPVPKRSAREVFEYTPDFLKIGDLMIVKTVFDPKKDAAVLGLPVETIKALKDMAPSLCALSREERRNRSPLALEIGIRSGRGKKL